MPTKLEQVIGYGRGVRSFVAPCPESGEGREGSHVIAPPASTKVWARFFASLVAVKFGVVAGWVLSPSGTAYMPSSSGTAMRPRSPSGRLATME